jgi:hypothetical protein
MPLPIVYRTGSSILANYNFAELASGQGYLTLYGGQADPSQDVLTNITFHSLPGWDDLNNTSSFPTLQKTYNFDMLLNRPLEIIGKALVNIPFYHNHSGASSPRWQFTVSLVDWDGATETLLATADSQIFTQTGSGGNLTAAVVMDITSIQRVEKDNYLRLKVECYAGANSGTVHFQVGHDPSGDLGSSALANSVLVAFVPVRIDI